VCHSVFIDWVFLRCAVTDCPSHAPYITLKFTCESKFLSAFNSYCYHHYCVTLSCKQTIHYPEYFICITVLFFHQINFRNHRLPETKWVLQTLPASTRRQQSRWFFQLHHTLFLNSSHRFSSYFCSRIAL
jgi:hypothetical protein